MCCTTIVGLPGTCLRRMLTTARVRISAEPAGGPPRTTLTVLSAKNGVCAKIGLAPNPKIKRITAVKILFMTFSWRRCIGDKIIPLAAPDLRFGHAELASRPFEEAVIDDLRDVERLRHFRILAYQIDHELHALRFHRHVADNPAAELLEHLAGESPVGEPPLLHDDTDHFVAIARFDAEKKSAQRGPHHAVDFLWIVLNLFDRSTESVLRETENIADEEKFVIALLHRDNIFRHAEERGVDRAGLHRRQPIVPESHHGHIPAGIESEVLERSV